MTPRIERERTIARALAGVDRSMVAAKDFMATCAVGGAGQRRVRIMGAAVLRDLEWSLRELARLRDETSNRLVRFNMHRLATAAYGRQRGPSVTN
jgi:hypothetical protein